MKNTLVFFLNLTFLLSLLVSINACSKMNDRNISIDDKWVWQLSLDEMFHERDARRLARFSAKGDLLQISKLLNDGVDVDVRGSLGTTPLLWALLKGNFKGYEFLIKSGADVNVIFDTSECLMWLAAQHENPKFLKAALDNGGKPNIKCGKFKRTPLYNVIEEDNSSKLKRQYLYDSGADVNVISPSLISPIVEGSKSSPLISAMKTGHYNTALELLVHGSDPYLKMPDGRFEITEIIKLTDRVLLKESEKWSEYQKVKNWLQENASELLRRKGV